MNIRGLPTQSTTASEHKFGCCWYDDDSRDEIGELVVRRHNGAELRQEGCPHGHLDAMRPLPENLVTG